MQFCEDGPDIDETLIEARRKGEVIFFCGSGVSKQDANMPNFAQLWERVIQRMPIPDWSALFAFKYSKSENDLPNELRTLAYERRFHQLCHLFPRPAVMAEVCRALYRDEADKPLKIKPEDLLAHRAILELSQYEVGGKNEAAAKTCFSPIITTNYDDLFVQAGKGLFSSEIEQSSYIDDISTKHSEPITFPIHGYFTEDQIKGTRSRALQGPDCSKYENTNDLVLTAGDYGKVYMGSDNISTVLSEIFTSKNIVFIGYSAEDATISYLLESLMGDPKGIKNIWAFDVAADSRTAKDVSHRWKSRGVNPLIAQGDRKNLAHLRN